MSRLNNDRPASLRSTEQGSRFTQVLARQAQKMVRAAIASQVVGSLPAGIAAQEAEDARLTGLTRSLNRRLLALNLRGRSLKQAPSV